jgi:hypothetical protein
MKYKFSKFFVRGGDEVSFLTANCWLGLGSLIGQKVPWGELGKQLLLRGKFISWQNATFWVSGVIRARCGGDHAGFA